MIWRTLLHRALLLAVFVGLPIGFGAWVTTTADRLEQDRQIDSQRRRIDPILSRLLLENDDPRMIARAFSRAFDRLATLDPPRQRALLVRLARRFPRMFDLAVFDQTGRLLERLSHSERTKGALERSYAILRRLRLGVPVSRGEAGLLKSVLLVPEPTRFRLDRMPINLGQRGRFGYVAGTVGEFARPVAGRPGGYFLFLHPDQMRPRGFALRHAIRYVNRRVRRFQVATLEVVREAKSPRVRSYPPAWRQTGLTGAVFRALGIFSPSFRHGRRHGRVRKLNASQFLVGHAPLPPGLPPQVVGVIQWFAVAWVIFGVIRIGVLGHLPVRLRISFKLVALFLYAVGPPMLSILIGGTFALRNQERLQRADLEAEILTKLQLFDAGLDDTKADLESQYRQIVAETRFRGGDLTYLKDRLTEMARRPPHASVFITDPSGEAILATCHSGADGAHFRETSKFALLLAREVLNRLNETFKLDGKQVMFEVTSSLLSSLMGANSNWTINNLMQDMGRFTEMGIGGEASLFLFDALYNREGQAQYCLMAVVQVQKLEEFFITNQLHRLEEIPALRLQASAYAKFGFIRSVARVPAGHPIVAQLLGQTPQPGSTARIFEDAGDGGRLWVAARGNKAADYTLVANLSMKPFHEENRQRWRWLLGVAAAMVMMTMTLGALLSEHFVKPIEGLTAGIRAVQERQFGHQIPICQEDEFGEMARLFNHVIEGMRDLSVATTVQESLIPQEPLAVGPYRVFGRSQAMTDIGGDYFDYFRLGERRLIVLVGDVSGHGVSAALVMAMAKCALTIDDRVDQPLLGMVSRFNRYLHQVMKRKKMMTMFVASIDLETQVLSFVNAGHNYPFVFRAATATVETLEVPGVPLGIRGKDSYEVHETTLHPGDGMLLYTDGVVEAQSATGLVVTYERAIDWYQRVGHQQPEAVVAEMKRQLDSFSAGAPVLDDISLIGIRRGS